MCKRQVNTCRFLFNRELVIFLQVLAGKMVFLKSMLKGKKILIGITGSIAAYKAVILVRELVKAGAEVKVIMTPAAADFVAPLTLSTLSRNPVLTALSDKESWANHVMLGRWADIMLIAPASCNTLAKMAAGICDNLLLAVYLSSVCPVMIAPAMDEDMWKHPATRSNLDLLAKRGHFIIPVGRGELASGLSGEGRMAEPEQIIRILTENTSPGKLKGKKVLVTAGPTYEPIDPVRFIGNHSSGKMGIALAESLYRKGAEVVLVLGPVGAAALSAGIETVHVQTAAEMYTACMKRFPETDLAVMAAAVADYTPESTASEKIKKTGDGIEIKLKKTPDILASLGNSKKQGQIVVGFALETENEEANAKEKLVKKNADMIVLNSLRDKGAGFGTATNKVHLFTKDDLVLETGTETKEIVADSITDTIIRLFYA